jgi:hypothetical protein
VEFITAIGVHGMQVQSVLYEEVQHRGFQPGKGEVRAFGRNDRGSGVEKGASIFEVAGGRANQRRPPADLALLAAAVGVRPGGHEELNDFDVVLVKRGCIEGRAIRSLLVWVGSAGQKALDFRHIAFLSDPFERMAPVAAVAVGDIKATAAGEDAQKREKGNPPPHLPQS